MKPIFILRVCLGVTFLWIGILIFKNPDAWVNFLSDWFVRLLPVSPLLLLKMTSFLDIGLGLAFVFNYQIKWAGLIGLAHMISILISSGITEITIRDVAILGACYYLFKGGDKE